MISGSEEHPNNYQEEQGLGTNDGNRQNNESSNDFDHEEEEDEVQEDYFESN